MLAGIYIILNTFIIILIWWPQKTTIPSYVAPAVATSVLGFGIIYWFGFAKVLPALGYGIDSDPDELVDGSRVVTYRVGLPNSRGSRVSIMLTLLENSDTRLAQHWRFQTFLTKSP